MNDAATSLETDDLSDFRAAQDRARLLRDQAIARERARIQALCTELEISPEELLGIARKRRAKKSKEADPETEQEARRG